MKIDRIVSCRRYTVILYLLPYKFGRLNRIIKTSDDPSGNGSNK